MHIKKISYLTRRMCLNITFYFLHILTNSIVEWTILYFMRFSLLGSTMILKKLRTSEVYMIYSNIELAFNEECYQYYTDRWGQEVS